MTITPEILRTLVPSARVELITDEACTITDELTLDDSSSLWLIRQGEKVFVCPVVEGDVSRRAQAGDFIVNKLPQGTHGKFHNDIEVFTEREVALSAEQTNESVILDNTYILKWQLTLSDTQSHIKEQTLANFGFPFTPPTRGHLTYDNQLIASLYDYIPETTDGWTCAFKKQKSMTHRHGFLLLLE